MEKVKNKLQLNNDGTITVVGFNKLKNEATFAFYPHGGVAIYVAPAHPKDFYYVVGIDNNRTIEDPYLYEMLSELNVDQCHFVFFESTNNYLMM